MIPPLNQDGNLPAGIHVCTLDEALSRFGQGSEERIVEASELEDFVRWARQVRVRRLLVDGSFVTARSSPNDVDVVILPGEGFEEHLELIVDQPDHWPFLHVLVARDEADLERWAKEDFGADRTGEERGILEIQLWPSR